MDWLGKMLNLLKSFIFANNDDNVIHGTTCKAILCTPVASRDKVLSRVGRDSILKLVVYLSDQTHCAPQKRQLWQSTSSLGERVVEFSH